MINKRILRIVLVLVLSSFLSFSAVAQEVDPPTEEVVTTHEEVVIEEEEVPLGLDSMATFEKYQRDVAAIIIFGSMVVSITVLATIKKNRDREKLN
jgi:hypothetical protein